MAAGRRQAGRQFCDRPCVESERWSARRIDHANRGKCGRFLRTTQESAVKLRTVAVFGVGYVLGTKAGRERYGQIIAAAQSASKRVEDYSHRLDSLGGKVDNLAERLDGFRARLRQYSGN